VRVELGQIPEAGCRALAALAELAGSSRTVWVVGGALRELLTGGGAADLDLAVTGDALALGRALADRLDARFVVLDEAAAPGASCRGRAALRWTWWISAPRRSRATCGRGLHGERLAAR
jgi:hypothetical protein